MPQIAKLPILLKLAFAAAMVIAPRALLAEDDQPGGDQSHGALFERLDANADGRLTRDEIPDDQQRLFNRLLRNADKVEDEQLTREDFTSGLQRRGDRRPRDAGDPERRRHPPGDVDPERVFERMDADGDGKLTLDEVPEPRREGFRRLLERFDRDDSDDLTLEEFRRGIRRGRPPGERGPERADQRGRQRPDDRDRRRPEDRGPRRRGDRDRPPEGGPPRGPERGPRGPEGPPPRPPLLRALDTDRDGTLSSSEVAAASESLKKLDRNDDGKISRRELMPPRPAGERFGRRAEAPRGEFRGRPEERREGSRDRADGPRHEPRGRSEGPERRSRGGPEGQRERFRDRTDGQRPPVDAIVRRIMNSDKDGDGKLSKDEAPERLREHFDQIDADDDGQIDWSELKKAMSRFGRRRGGERSGPPRGRPNRPARSEEG